MLIGYLVVAPKAFVLGPLAVLLLLSRPRTAREWFWIGLCVVLAAVMLRLPATLTGRTIRAAEAFFTGAFVIATVWGVRSLVTRALLAVTASAVVTAGWFAALGIHWSTLRTAFVNDYWVTWRLLSPDLPARPPLMGETGVTAAALQIAAAIRDAAGVMPGVLAVFAMAGGYLAWNWYWRLASRPLGPPPQPFRLLRFSDHLVWLLIASAAAALLTPDSAVGIVGRNLLVLMVVLYAGRGLAIVQTSLLPAPRLFVVLVSVTAILLLPFAIVPCVLIGTADTWLDFRRRMAPAEGATS